MADRITMSDRLELLAELERLADACNQVAVILDREDAGAEAHILEHAAEQIAAACWLVEHPIRRYNPAWLRPAANGSDPAPRAPR